METSAYGVSFSATGSRTQLWAGSSTKYSPSVLEGEEMERLLGSLERVRFFDPSPNILWDSPQHSLDFDMLDRFEGDMDGAFTNRRGSPMRALSRNEEPSIFQCPDSSDEEDKDIYLPPWDDIVRAVWMRNGAPEWGYITLKGMYAGEVVFRGWDETETELTAWLFEEIAAEVRRRYTRRACRDWTMVSSWQPTNKKHRGDVVSILQCKECPKKRCWHTPP